MFNFFRLALIPFVLFATTLLIMGAHVIATTMYHRHAWPQTVATIVESETVTLQNGKTELSVAVSYVVDGKPAHWEGLAKDIGIYEGKPGDLVALHYDASDPSQLDTAMMKGWRGAVLMLTVTGGIAGAYLWFFWLRSRRRGGPPAGGVPGAEDSRVSASAFVSSPLNATPITPPAFGKPTRTFGKR